MLKSQILIFSVSLLLCSFTFAQVGINTISPRTTLEVNGDVSISESIMIGNVTHLTDDEENTFMTQKVDDKLCKLDVSNPTGAALAYIQEYRIDNMYADFVSNFDTQINANDYVLVIISSNFNDDLNLPNTSNLSQNFSLPFTATFIQGGTWRITANYPVAGNFGSSNIGSWNIKTLIFHKDLSKQLGTVNIPMSNTSTGSASTPIIN